MKKIYFRLVLFSLLVFSLALVFYKPQPVSAQQYSCVNRNPSCQQNQYPNCQTAVGQCNPPGCIVSMYLKNGSYVLDCAYPATITSPPGTNYCGWDSNNNPVDYCVSPYVAQRKTDPNTGHRSCYCAIPQPTPSPFPNSKCPVCPKNYHYHYSYKSCCKNNETPECKTATSPIIIDCSATGKNCVPGCGCGIESCPRTGGIQPTECDTPAGPKTGIQTALGCIPTEANQFVAWLLKIAIGLGGGIAFLLMIGGAIQLLTSSGNPEGIKAGGETITSALMGLLFIIFSLFLLHLIGVDILKIPGFSK